jgi:hypothetical protein
VEEIKVQTNADRVEPETLGYSRRFSGILLRHSRIGAAARKTARWFEMTLRLIEARIEGDIGMKNSRSLFFAALLTLGNSALGQSTMIVTPAATPQRQPVPTIASVTDREISNVEKQILDVADAVPEAKYNFSPESLNIAGGDFKGVRTLAAQLKHVAASNYFIWSPLTGDKLPEGLKDGNGPENVKTKAEIIQFLKDSFALGHKAAATLSLENVLQPPEGSKSTRLHLAEFGVAHAFNHYGQLVEYLRMNGIVPPASRGKSE